MGVLSQGRRVAGLDEQRILAKGARGALEPLLATIDGGETAPDVRNARALLTEIARSRSSGRARRHKFCARPSHGRLQPIASEGASPASGPLSRTASKAGAGRNGRRQVIRFPGE